MDDKKTNVSATLENAEPPCRASNTSQIAGQPSPKRQRLLDGAKDKEAIDAASTSTKDNVDNVVSSTQSKESLMPPCPKVPPVASTERKVKKDKGWRWAPQHGMDPPSIVYCPADTALWPEEAADLFRATKINRDPKYASRYMRWWFENHEGMPARVPKIPRSAYSMYYTDQKRVIFLSRGKFNTSRDGKKIGASWKVLSDEDKQPYFDKFAVLKVQREENEDWWEKEVAAWQDERRERIRSEGVELDPTKRQSVGLEPLCECSKCGPISDISVNES